MGEGVGFLVEEIAVWNEGQCRIAACGADVLTASFTSKEP